MKHKWISFEISGKFQSIRSDRIIGFERSHPQSENDGSFFLTTSVDFGNFGIGLTENFDTEQKMLNRYTQILEQLT
jgi:hypothetical protein